MLKAREKLIKRIISLLLLITLTIACLTIPSVKAQTDSIVLGDQIMVSNGVYKVSAVVTGEIKTISISATDVKIKLTQVSGSGFSFRNGVVNSTIAHSTPDTTSEYISVQLTVNSAAEAMTALDTVRYTGVKSSGSHIKITGDVTILASGDYYLDGHYYTLSQSGSMSWKQGMEWAFNLMTNDSTRYSGYKSYPIVVNSVEENQMLTNIYYNNGNTKRQIFLPAVPAVVEPGSGSITVSGIDGNKTVTVDGEPYVKTGILSKSAPYGHGSAWVWLVGTPNAGETLPEESFSSGKGVYWSSGNPTDGGMVYFGHPSDGAYWDDLTAKKSGGSWSNNVWTEAIGEQFAGHMYALAEWEPIEGLEISDTKSLVIQTHSHSWEYTTSSVNTTNDTLLAYCTENVASVLCNYQGSALDLSKAVAITLESDSPTYSGLGITDGWKYGEELTFNIDNSNQWKSIVGENTLPELEYTGTETTNYNTSTTQPTVPGTYEVSIKKGEAVAKLPFEIRYEIQFIANGGSGTMQKVTTMSDNYQLPECNFINPRGKELAGWSTTSNGAVLTTDSISINANTNLYAIWKKHNHSLHTIVLQNPSEDSEGITAEYCDCGFYILNFDDN